MTIRSPELLRRAHGAAAATGARRRSKAEREEDGGDHHGVQGLTVSALEGSERPERAGRGGIVHGGGGRRWGSRGRFRRHTASRHPKLHEEGEEEATKRPGASIGSAVAGDGGAERRQ